MKYSKRVTERFANAIKKKDCLEAIDQLIFRDGYTERAIEFKGDEFVLNMDCVEAAVAAAEERDLKKSMDSAFIVEDGRKREIVLVEYRFNYANLSHLSRSDLLGKVEGSISALDNPRNIHDSYYFVFNSNLKQQAISRLNRMNPTVPQQYLAVDMEDIKQLFFD